MDDAQIVELYWARKESAIEETEAKYGSYCRSIALNILHNPEDAAESVNDTWLSAWNSMPPHRPSVLSSFLGKLTRRISIDKWRRTTAKKRSDGQMPLILAELEDCISDGKSIEEETERKLLTEVIATFVKCLPETEQKVFLCRYWYMDSVGSIATRFRFSESKVKSMLFRTREKLRTCLEKEGLV
ncbi:MAG: sigma-70 family RNA polymerase sigma factor [Lachnospiraceae bacterium]|nr:sigma-70 family RNA polymerase sigma factor [Lachnospiraceae bacterium]